MWDLVPSRFICHCYLLATRVGEASNPGPNAGQETAPNTQNAPAAFDISNLLGPNFGAMLQSFIQQQIQTAVQEAVQRAMQQFHFGTQAHPPHEPPKQEAPPPKRRRKGKGEGAAVSPSAVPAESNAGSTGQDQGKAKGKIKGKQPNKVELPPSVQGRGSSNKGQPGSKAEGKGKGGAEQALKAQPPAQQEEWKQVQRKRDKASDQPFELRQQDWNAPLVAFGNLAKRLQETKDGEVCRGVILCPAREVATARALLSGTAKKFAILLIVLAKDFHDPPKDMTPQKVPGKVGVMLRSQDAYLQQACSKDQCAPQPVGISSAPQKIATKATAVLFVKVPKIFVDAQMWKQFIEKPQRQIAQWTAIHHVLCIDCFSWAEEQLQGGRRQVHGVIRVAQADVSTLLSHSGEQGIFLQLPRDKVSGQHVEWAERTTKNEPDAEYLTRVNRSRGDLGLVCRDNSLGWRRTNDPDSPVRKVWVLEHAPKQ